MCGPLLLIGNIPGFYFGKNRLDVVDHYRYLDLNQVYFFQILLKKYKNDTFFSPWVMAVKNVWKVMVSHGLGNTNISHLVHTIFKSYNSNVSGTNSFRNGHLN